MRRSRNPCAVLADTRRVCPTLPRLRALRRPAWLRRDCACTSYSVFKEPTRPQRTSAIPDAHSPRLAGPDQPLVGRIQGNLLRLLQPLPAVNPRAVDRAGAICRRQSTATYGLGENLPSCCPTWEPGNPGTWGLRTPKGNSILRAEEGLVNPRPGAYHPRKNCLTYGRSTLTRISKRVTDEAGVVKSGGGSSRPPGARRAGRPARSAGAPTSSRGPSHR